MPNLLQAAIFAREFSDVLYFTKPPLLVQRLLFGTLAAIARALGYRGSYPKYSGSQELLKYSGSQELLSSEQAGPPSRTRVMAGGLAMTASLLVASLFLVRRVRRLTKG